MSRDREGEAVSRWLGEGVRVITIGTARMPPASLDFGRGAADPIDGNADLLFASGTLRFDAGSVVNIGPATLPPTVNPDDKPSLVLKRGLFHGSFPHTDHTRPAFHGILLNKEIIVAASVISRACPSGWRRGGEWKRAAVTPD